MTAQKPATALPWELSDQIASDGDRWIKGGDDVGTTVARIEGDDAAYIAHAANAYPALVAALRCAVEWETMMREKFGDRYPLDLRPSPNVRAVDARALLRSLGEGV